jgi:hypothetical protein
MPTPYPRKTLTELELAELLKAAVKIANQPSGKSRIIIARLLAENASLAAECNEHRQARDLEPLQTFEPRFKI